MVVEWKRMVFLYSQILYRSLLLHLNVLFRYFYQITIFSIMFVFINNTMYFVNVFLFLLCKLCVNSRLRTNQFTSRFQCSVEVHWTPTRPKLRHQLPINQILHFRPVVQSWPDVYFANKVIMFKYSENCLPCSLPGIRCKTQIVWEYCFHFLCFHFVIFIPKVFWEQRSGIYKLIL